MFLETGDWHPSGQPSSPFLFPGQCSDRPCASSPPLGRCVLQSTGQCPHPDSLPLLQTTPGWAGGGMAKILSFCIFGF